MKEFSDYKVNYPVEEWAPCPKLPDLFDISTEGRLYSLRSKRLVKLNPINGYLGHVTKVGGRLGKAEFIKCHIEVAKAFIFNPLPYQYDQVNHIDGNKLNPMWWNLEWTDQVGNSRHARENELFDAEGFKLRILTNGRFTPEEFRYIASESKSRSLRSIGREFNTNHSTLKRYIDRWIENNK